MDRQLGRYARHVGPTTPGAATKVPPPEAPKIAMAAYPGFERMEIVDKYTVRFVNSVPDATLEGRLTRNTGVIFSHRAFAEATTWLDWARQPVGTGPYRIVEYKPDAELVLEAFDDYWGGRPPIKRLRFVEVPEVAPRVNGLRAGDFDFACDMPPDQIAAIESNPKLEVVGGPIMNIRLTIFDKHHPVLKDARVRRAMTHAVDRQAIVDALWWGRTKVPKGLQWDFFGPMLLGDWAPPAYDPAEAKAPQGSGLRRRADPLPDAEQLLHQPGSRPRRSWSSSGRRSASTSRSR